MQTLTKLYEQYTLNGGFKLDEIMAIYSGRRTGKSHFAQQMYWDAAELAIYNAKMRMHRHATNVWQSIIWKYSRGPKVLVKWPSGMVDLRHRPDILTSWESADPNDHYRRWLEENIGVQGTDWEWEAGVVDISYSNGDMADKVLIRLRKRHSHFASMITLMWS